MLSALEEPEANHMESLGAYPLEADLLSVAGKGKLRVEHLPGGCQVHASPLAADGAVHLPTTLGASPAGSIGCSRLSAVGGIGAGTKATGLESRVEAVVHAGSGGTPGSSSPAGGGDVESHKVDVEEAASQVEVLTLTGDGDESWVCAICREHIPIVETAQLKGCEHAYCVTCILSWATHLDSPWCPQCRSHFSTLHTYRSLDGSLSDSMVEESVCLLLRAHWFKPLALHEEEPADHHEDFFYEDYDEDYDNDSVDDYYPTTVRLGNRRWGQGGFVRGGHKEARPVVAVRGKSPAVAAGAAASSSSPSSSSWGRAAGACGSVPPGEGKSPAAAGGGQAKRNKAAVADGGGSRDAAAAGEQLGRRARRAQKREGVDGKKETAGAPSRAGPHASTCGSRC
eukprot:jgi/Mesen1/10133/ME000075S09634